MERMQFEAFKNTQRHLLKDCGVKKYVQAAINELENYEKNNWNAELLFTVALIEYVCRTSNTDCPDLSKYDNLTLAKCLYPSDVVLLFSITGEESILSTAYEKSIPEFRMRNIVEVGVDEIA